MWHDGKMIENVGGGVWEEGMATCVGLCRGLSKKQPQVLITLSLKRKREEGKMTHRNHEGS